MTVSKIFTFFAISGLASTSCTTLQNPNNVEDTAEMCAELANILEGASEQNPIRMHKVNISTTQKYVEGKGYDLLGYSCEEKKQAIIYKRYKKVPEFSGEAAVLKRYVTQFKDGSYKAPKEYFIYDSEKKQWIFPFAGPFADSFRVVVNHKEIKILQNYKTEDWQKKGHTLKSEGYFSLNKNCKSGEIFDYSNISYNVTDENGKVIRGKTTQNKFYSSIKPKK